MTQEEKEIQEAVMSSSACSATNAGQHQQQQALTAIVIGAGPAGLASALGLAKVCETVVLVEKHASFSQQGSTFGVAPNGRKALQELHPAVWERLVNVGVPLPSGGLMLPWWEMRDALLEQVKDVDNIELHTGQEFTEIIQTTTDGANSDDGGGVQVKFKSGWTVSGDFLVGADGVHSDVREWLGLPPALSTGSIVFRGSLMVQDGDDSSSDKLKSLLQGGLVPHGAHQLDGVYFIVFNFHSKQPGRLAWALSTTRPLDDNATPLSVMSQVLDDDPDELALLKEIFDKSDREHWIPYPSTKVIDFSNESLESLGGGWGGRGRVVLVGDAAHAMRPTDGQGGNQAFEDAVVLSRTLIASMQQQQQQSCSESSSSSPAVMSIEETLRTFEAARLPRVKRIHDDQRMRYEKRMRGEKVGPMPDEFREWIEQGV